MIFFLEIRIKYLKNKDNILIHQIFLFAIFNKIVKMNEYIVKILIFREPENKDKSFKLIDYILFQMPLKENMLSQFIPIFKIFIL